jgi:hypothetical protein
MLTRMTERDWAVVLRVLRAACSRRGDKGRDDRKFLEALHYFTVHSRGRLDLLRKSGEFPMSYEELDDTAATVYEGI